MPTKFCAPSASLHMGRFEKVVPWCVLGRRYSISDAPDAYAETGELDAGFGSSESDRLSDSADYEMR